MIKNYQNWGDVYSITFDITVIKQSSITWMEVFRFTATNENCCNNGDRIPALFINPAGTFHFSSSLYNGENYNYVHDIDFVLGETYSKKKVFDSRTLFSFTYIIQNLLMCLEFFIKFIEILYPF